MELARPAMAAAPARERGERERERAGSGEEDGEGVLVPLLIGSRAHGGKGELGGWHGARVSPMGGHDRRMKATEAIPRARGGHQRRQGGEPIWAGSGSNWTLGQKQSLLTLACSTYFI